jgi:hypothetical protein
MPKYATGKYAKAISDRSGMEFPYREMVREWNGSFVHVSEFEPKQPQLEPKPLSADGISLRHVRPGRAEPTVLLNLRNDPFETFKAGSAIINVFAPGHGLTNGTTHRFRGSVKTSPGTGTPYNPNTGASGTAVSGFSSILNFDGISGSNIERSAGYTITTGLYKTVSGIDQRITTDYSLSNFFHFTVATNTATVGQTKGGGNGCSVGPVSLES